MPLLPRTPEADALVAAIVSDPDDAGARLAFAEFLLAAGFPEPAEMIGGPTGSQFAGFAWTHSLDVRVSLEAMSGMLLPEEATGGHYSHQVIVAAWILADLQFFSARFIAETDTFVKAVRAASEGFQTIQRAVEDGYGVPFEVTDSVEAGARPMNDLIDSTRRMAELVRLMATKVVSRGLDQPSG